MKASSKRERRSEVNVGAPHFAITLPQTTKMMHIGFTSLYLHTNELALNDNVRFQLYSKLKFL